MKLIVKLLGFC